MSLSFCRTVFVLLICVTIMSGASSVRAQSQSATDGSKVSSQETKEPLVQNYKLSKEKLDRAIAYSRIRNIFHFASVGYSLVLLFIILSLKTGPRFRTIAEQVSKYKFIQVFI